jgi:hypothetical protein
MHGEGFGGGGWWFFGHGIFGILIWIILILAIVWLVKDIFKK